MSRLVLTRSAGNEVVIHEDGEILCKIFITRVERGNVRMSFEASKNVRIDRKEIFDSKIERGEV